MINASLFSTVMKVRNRLFHPQIKKILVNRDVVFVEDAIQPLLSCTKETHVRSSQDMNDTLLPLFNGAHPNVEPFDAHVEARNQPLQVHDQHFDDGGKYS